jgi:hypothetical protein
LQALAMKDKDHHAIHNNNTVENDGRVFSGSLKKNHYKEQDDCPSSVNHDSFEQRSMGWNTCEPVAHEVPQTHTALIAVSCNGWTDSRTRMSIKRALIGAHNPRIRMCHFVAGGRDDHPVLISHGPTTAMGSQAAVKVSAA